MDMRGMCYNKLLLYGFKPGGLQAGGNPIQSFDNK